MPTFTVSAPSGGLLGVVLRLRPEWLGVVEFEDVDLDLVRLVADRVVGGVRHPVDIILGEALGPAVDLLEQVVGVERLQVLRAVLGDLPAAGDVDQREHRRDGSLTFGDGGELGVGGGLDQAGGDGSGRRRRNRNGVARDWHADNVRGHLGSERAAGGAVKSINCWGASRAISLRIAASLWSTAGIACAVAGDWLQAGPA